MSTYENSRLKVEQNQHLQKKPGCRAANVYKQDELRGLNKIRERDQ
jgi:hypothetical protein